MSNEKWFCGGCGETDPNKRCIGCMHGMEIKQPQPEAPAIEYAITAGPGRLIDFGVTTEPMKFNGPMTDQYDGELLLGSIGARLHVAPTTTSCMTGK